MIKDVALFTRAWIEMAITHLLEGYKCMVALFTRAWIEISESIGNAQRPEVALFTRAWIEISYISGKFASQSVALFTRAWIEIFSSATLIADMMSPSSRGRGLKYPNFIGDLDTSAVALFTRAWIEIQRYGII